MKISNTNLNFGVGNGVFGQDATIQERIAGKKQFYEKQARRIVTSADTAERKVDKNVAEHNARVEELLAELKEANSSVRDMEDEMKNLQEEYGVQEGSKEQQDLELMKKASDARRVGSGVELTKEDMEQLAQLGEPTEYQSRVMGIYEAAGAKKEEIADFKREMQGEITAVRMIGIERLKMRGMEKAQQMKEELLEAASQEAMNMLIADAKDQVDTKTEETIKEAEDQKEKTQEQEDRIESAKEAKAETVEMVERNRDKVKEMTEQIVTGQDTTDNINAEIKQMMEEQKMLEEELKGLVMDTSV